MRRLVPALILALLLSGCAVPTAESLYALPGRPRGFARLEAAMDASMAGLTYAAPTAGDHRQTVQTADLDGDGAEEYLLFAKGDGAEPMRVLIFRAENGDYGLWRTLTCPGEEFTKVGYAPLDGLPGLELLLSTSDADASRQQVRAYGFSGDAEERLAEFSCEDFTWLDLNGDSQAELLALTEDTLSLYDWQNGRLRSEQTTPLSAYKDRQILPGVLRDETPALFVTGLDSRERMVTDVVFMADGVLDRHAQLLGSPKGQETTLYPRDLDGDGIVELPELVTVPRQAAGQGFVCWYSLDAAGQRRNKDCMYVDPEGRWEILLGRDLIGRVTAGREGAETAFYLWDPADRTETKILTIYAFTGADREEQAGESNRFVLLRTGGTTYCARLEVASGRLELTQEGLIAGFTGFSET